MDYHENFSGQVLLILLCATGPVHSITTILPSSTVTLSGAGAPNTLSDILKTLPPALASFAATLPAVEGKCQFLLFTLPLVMISRIYL